MIIGPDDSRLIPVTVGRGLTDKAAVVNINVVSAPEGVVVPATVEFAANEQTTQFFIDIENMPSKSSGTITLSLPEDVTSPYAAGTSGLSFNVSVSGAWIPVSDNVVLSTDGVYPDMNTKLYFLDGTNTFKLPDFFGSCRTTWTQAPHIPISDGAHIHMTAAGSFTTPRMPTILSGLRTA